MKLIQIEGLPFELIYFYANESFEFSQPLNQDLRPFLPFMEKELKNHFNLRLILIKGFLGYDAYFVQYLYFEPDKFPRDLDEKVRSNTFTDADFEDSVVTKFQNTYCVYCKWKGPTLCVERDYYYKNFELYLEKTRKLEYKLCPNCGESLRQSVVMIF